jgi:hypothetical protein
MTIRCFDSEFDSERVCGRGNRAPGSRVTGVSFAATPKGS